MTRPLTPGERKLRDDSDRDLARLVAFKIARDEFDALAAERPRSNVTRLRPAVDPELYNYEDEARTLSASVWEWSLVVVALEKMGQQGCTDLARRIRDRLDPPSARRGGAS